jgi:cytochrome P450
MMVTSVSAATLAIARRGRRNFLSQIGASDSLFLMAALSSASQSSLSLSAWVEVSEVVLPPGPAGRFATNIGIIRKPIEALRAWQAQYGHTFTIDRVGVPTVMTADPELIGELHGANDPELFAAAVPDAADVLLGTRSLLLIAGRQHKRERKLMTPPFHGERMRGWATAMADVGRRTFAESGEIRAMQRTQLATLEVIVRVIFGVDDDERVQEFIRAVNEWTMSVRSSFLFLRGLQRDFFGLSPFARYRKARARVDALLDAQIARTRAGRGGRTDVLTGLIEARYDDGSGMDDDTIRDHLRTLLFAGHETTAIVLAWALYFVHRDPEVRRRVLDELASLGPNPEPELLARLPYLGAVVDETLRMRPVTVDTQRVLRKPMRLGRWHLPAGAAVCPATTLLHFREDLWTAPEVFLPDRFLGKKPAPNTYMPFGGVVHRCLGATFARFEACVILGTVLREYRFELLDQQVEWGRGRGTLEPLGGVRMRCAKLGGA